MAYKKSIIFIFIFFLFNLPFYIFTLDAKRDSKKDSERMINEKIFKKKKDLTSDINKNIQSKKDQTSDKKNTNTYISFYSNEGFFAIFNPMEISTLTKSSEADVSINYQSKFYSLNAYFNELVFLDIYSIYRMSNNIIEEDERLNFINKVFSTGINNEFNIYKMLKIRVNFDFYAATYFNDIFTFIPIPSFGFSGNYYHGFYWSLDERAIPKIDGVNFNNSQLEVNTLGNIGYELFRFYGPLKFRFGFDTFDDQKIILPYANPAYLTNNFKTGIFFKYFNVKQYAYFIMNITSYLDLTTSNEIGFSTGIDYKINYFKFILSYTGYIDIYDPNYYWNSNIDFSFKFFL